MYAVAITLASIGIQFANVGLHVSTTFAVAADRLKGPSVATNSVVVSLLAGGGLGVLLLGLKATGFDFGSPASLPLIALVATYMPVGLAFLWLQAVLLAGGHLMEYNLGEVVTRLGFLGSIGLIIVTGIVSPETAMVANVLAAAGGVGFVSWALVRRFGPFGRFDPGLLRAHAAYGLRAWIATLFAFLVLRLDLLIVDRILGHGAAGAYAVAANLAEVVYLLPVTIGTIAFPRFVRMKGSDALASAKRLAALTGASMVGLSTVAAIVARPAVRILYGEEFLTVVDPFLWLLPAVVILSANTILMNYFASIGNPWIVILGPAVGAFVNVVLNVFLLPVLGVVGASIASCLAYSLMLACSLIYVLRFMPRSSNSRDSLSVTTHSAGRNGLQ